jgi:hypothetical protein
MQRSGFLSSLLWVMDILGSYGDTSFSWLGFSFLPGSQFIPLVFQPAPSSPSTQAGFLCHVLAGPYIFVSTCVHFPLSYPHIALALS